jgi:hypothetical protein
VEASETSITQPSSLSGASISQQLFSVGRRLQPPSRKGRTENQRMSEQQPTGMTKQVIVSGGVTGDAVQ